MASTRIYVSYLKYLLGRADHLLIHIPKNAGVAFKKNAEIRKTLVACEPTFHINRDYTRRVGQTMKRDGEHHGYQHARLRDINPNVRRSLTPVATVRNPWARTVSRFRFSQLVNSQGKRPLTNDATTFEAFLEERHEWGDREFYWHRAIRGWYQQLDYVVDEAGDVPCDILRHEHLATEATEYFGLTKPLARANSSGPKSKSYRDFYTPETIQIVADWYQTDIDYFGFDFDSPATRNTKYVGEEHSPTQTFAA